MKSQIASQTTLELMELVETGDIGKALLILDTDDETCGKEFLEPWGSLQVTLAQLAAWRGSLQILKRLDILGADLNSTDKFGRCALHHAARQGHSDVVRWLLERKATVESRFGISFLPKSEPYIVDGTSAANYEIGKNLPLPECWGRTPLHQAVEAKHVYVVKLLVDAGADVDACDEKGLTPLHLASSNVSIDNSDIVLRYEKIIDILVSASASVNLACRYTGDTALHDAVRLGNHRATERLLKGGAYPAARLLITGITPLHMAVITGAHQTLDILLAYVSGSTIDVQDESGKTPLHEAVYQGDPRCIRALVDCGGNLAAEENCGETVMSAIFGHVASPVAFLTDILDARVHATDNTTSQVILDFRVLAPQGELQMAIISAMIRSIQGMEQMKILQHPLVEAFLGLKWFHLRRFFCILVIVYVFYLISLSGYAILLLYGHNEPFPRRMLILSSCILIFHNMLQLILMPRHYAKEFETWFSLTSVMISVVIGITEEATDEPIPRPILRAISIAIMLAWIEMMLLVARFPTWGYYALMFSAVLKNVLKVLLAFVWLIVGFALSFSILYHDKKQFNDPWKAVVKTVVMMTGEFEYNELFATNSTNLNSPVNRTTFLSFLSGIVFLMFVMLASIVLMNLMIGLAVSDIQGLLNMGHIRRLMKQAEFVAHLERLTSHRMFQGRLVPRSLREMLESKNKISTQLTLQKPTEYEKGAHGISGQLVEVLFDLASANWDFDKDFQTDSPSGGSRDCSLTKTIYYLQERIKELQREKLRRQRIHSLKRKGGRRRKGIPSSNADNLIEEVLPILNTKHWTTVEEFLVPRGQLHCTIIHLASYTARYEILERAEALQVDLYVTDNFGRSALHYAAGQGHIDIVKWLVKRSTFSYQLQLQDIFGRTALHLAVKAKHLDVVTLLVDARVDVNVRDVDKMSPLHLAWLNVDWNDPEQMSRYENIVNMLLGSVEFKKFVDVPVGVSRIMVLSSAVRLNSIEATRQLLEHGLIVPKNPHQFHQITSPLHIAANHGFHQTLCTLLEFRPLTSWMINMKDELSRTPLQIAVSQGQLKCAHTLVMNKASLVSSGKNWPTVIEALFRYNEQPMSFLRNIFDAGISITENNPNMAVLDFEILAPHRELQMAVISELISVVPIKEQANILQHPVVEAFLGLKWKRLRYFYITMVTFRLLFVGCTYAYGITLLNEGVDSSTPRRLLFVFAGTLLCHTTLKLIMIPKYYTKQFDTWLSIISMTICIVVTIVEEFRYSSGQPSPSWVLQSISITILLAYIQLMVLFGRLPDLGHYALMFITVLKNVLKVTLIVVWIVIGFSLSFSVLFHSNGHFDSPWNAFMKTVVMMMGEYEYSTLFSSADPHDAPIVKLDSDQSQDTLPPIIKKIVFLAFVVLASIVLMNLMIGLAVTDIQGLLVQGFTLRLGKQAEFVAHLERVTSHWIFRSRIVPKCLRTMLKSMNTIPVQIKLGLSARYGKRPRGISKKQVKQLFELARKNRSLHKNKFQRSYSRPEHEDGLAETILHLQETLERLQEKIRTQGVVIPVRGD